MRRRRLGVVLVAAVAAGPLAVPALAAAPKPVVQKDAAGDVTKTQRAKLAKEKDGSILVSGDAAALALPMLMTGVLVLPSGAGGCAADAVRQAGWAWRNPWTTPVSRRSSRCSALVI